MRERRDRNIRRGRPGCAAPGHRRRSDDVARRQAFRRPRGRSIGHSGNGTCQGIRGGVAAPGRLRDSRPIGGGYRVSHRRPSCSGGVAPTRNSSPIPPRTSSRRRHHPRRRGRTYQGRESAPEPRRRLLGTFQPLIVRIPRTRGGSPEAFAEQARRPLSSPSRAFTLKDLPSLPSIWLPGGR